MPLYGRRFFARVGREHVAGCRGATRRADEREPRDVERAVAGVLDLELSGVGLAERTDPEVELDRLDDEVREARAVEAVGVQRAGEGVLERAALRAASTTTSSAARSS